MGLLGVLRARTLAVIGTPGGGPVQTSDVVKLSYRQVFTDEGMCRQMYKTPPIGVGDGGCGAAGPRSDIRAAGAAPLCEQALRGGGVRHTHRLRPLQT
eukprot:1295837-Pyramimonas_sp.AAC.1